MYTLPPRLVLDVSIVDAMLSVQFAEMKCFAILLHGCLVLMLCVSETSQRFQRHVRSNVRLNELILAFIHFRKSVKRREEGSRGRGEESEFA